MLESSSAERTYRVFGIPLAFDKRKLETLLKHTLEKHDCHDTLFQVRSLAPAATKLDLVATVDFDTVPPVLLSGKQELRIQSIKNNENPHLDICLSFDNQFLGLTPLYASSKNSATANSAEIDIIALSGPGSHAFGSFKPQRDDYMWLRDELPKRVPSSRIWIYGYDLNVRRGSSEQTLAHLSNALAANLETVVDSPSPSPRPLVLIGHSLGGLVIKQALINISERTQQSGHVLDSLSNLLFFGVPNKGIVNESLLDAFGHSRNEHLMQALGSDSQVLQLQQKEFSRLISSNDCEVYCFYETKCSPKTKLNHRGERTTEGSPEELVTRDSAICFKQGDISKAVVCAIDSNHSDLVKFKRHGKDAEFVFKVLANASADAQGIAEDRLRERDALSNLEVECLKTLAFDGMHYREQSIAPGSFSSGEWLYEHPKYQSWAVSRTELLSIRGNPGVGKSTVMKDLAVKARKNPKVLTLSFFFYAQGSPEQYSPHGMIRSLLHQLTSQCPQNCQRLFDTYYARCSLHGAYDQKWKWAEAELAEMFRDVLLLTGRYIQIQILVDALDEAGERVARQIVGELNQLVNKAQEGGARLRVALSSRHFPDIYIDPNQEIIVQDYNDHDIETYIRNTLEQQKGQFSEISINELMSEMMKVSRGNFQWAKLVLDEIREKRVSSGSGQKLRDLISTIPPDLTSLYSRLLDQVKDKDREDCVKLFEWVAFAARPLELAEMRVALVLVVNSDLSTLQKLQSHEGFLEERVHLQERIRALSKGLITIEGDEENSVLRFIHQSVQDFVTSEGLGKLQICDPDSISSKAHLRLFRCCLQYLRLKEVYDFCENYCSARGIPIWQLHIHSLDFLKYAIEEWTFHGESALKGDFGDANLPLHEFDGVSQRAFDAWTRAYSRQNFIHDPSDGTDLYHILAAIGLDCAFSQEQCELLRFDVCDSNGRQPLSIASETGHAKVVDLLTRNGPSEINLPDKDGRTPLWWAIFNSHTEVVRVLLHTGKVDVNSRDEFGRTPIWRAIYAGNIEVLRLLLETGQVDVGSRDKKGDLPLFIAIKEGKYQMVRLLLETGKVDVNSCNNDGETALIRAVHGGSVELVRVLLDTCRFKFTSRDLKMLFGWAAAAGHVELVPLMLEAGKVDANFRGDRGETLLMLAVTEGNAGLVRMILERCDADCNLTDKGGVTLLCRAASRGNTEVMRLLLANSQAKSAPSGIQTAFLQAVAGGHVGMVRLLLETGWVNINHRDPIGRTPLALAVSRQRLSVARELLETGQFDVNTCDYCGYTPLSEALEQGDVEMVQLLLGTGKVDVTSRYKHGQTPLSHAAKKGNAKILQAVRQAVQEKTRRRWSFQRLSWTNLACGQRLSSGYNDQD